MCCCRKLLRVPWTAKRTNQSILKEVNPEYSLEGLMLKLNVRYLATWCEDLTHWKRPWCWERLKVGEGDDRGWDGWVESLTQWTWVWAGSGRWWRTGKPGMLQSMGLQRAGHDCMTKQQQQCAKHSTGCRGYRAPYDVITQEALLSNGGDRQEGGHVRWRRCHENAV